MESIKIIKDSCKYSNLFHKDTLQLLESFSDHNVVAHKNIVTWNAGKSARKGNGKDFLVNAGAVVRTTTSSNSTSAKSGFISWFSLNKAVVNSPTAAPNTSTSSTNQLNNDNNIKNNNNNSRELPTVSSSKVKNSISPSPQSQNIALFEQQLERSNTRSILGSPHTPKPANLVAAHTTAAVLSPIADCNNNNSTNTNRSSSDDFGVGIYDNRRLCAASSDHLGQSQPHPTQYTPCVELEARKS